MMSVQLLLKKHLFIFCYFSISHYNTQDKVCIIAIPIDDNRMPLGKQLLLSKRILTLSG